MTKAILNADTDAESRIEAGSLQRGLSLLEVIQAAQRPLSATDLAEITKYPLSTVHRLLQALARTGYLSRDVSKRYFPGPKALLPLDLYHPLNVLRRDAREHLRGLREQFRQTSSLIIFTGIERLVVELAVENDSLSPYHATHLKSPLHGAASGKLLLASLGTTERKLLLGPGPYAKHGPNTITDPDAFTQELETIRTRGFATAIDENYAGLSAASAPIEAPGGAVIGCFCIAGMSTAFQPAVVHEAGQVLKLTADLFSIGSTSVRALPLMLGVGTCDSTAGSFD